MVAWMVLCLVWVQVPSIGSGLSEDVVLVYTSGGTAQAPWVYESVRAVPREGFDRCVRIGRRDQPVREVCVRSNTLFESDGKVEPRATRPIGPNMRLEVVAASGQLVRYETGSLASRTVAGGGEVAYLPTTLTTLGADGVPVRRLREEYAPTLLTALSGEFEEPDGSGGWRKVRDFSLTEIRRQDAAKIEPSESDTGPDAAATRPDRHLG